MLTFASSMDTCRICGNIEDNRTFLAREMMFGTREEFRYFECSRCGCLQIAEIPPDISRFYPKDYYSYLPPTGEGRFAFARRYLKLKRIRHVLDGEASMLGRWAAKRFPAPGYLANWFQPAGVKSRDQILEVGCGNGSLLVELESEGFRNLTGADPFVENDITYPGGVRVLKRRLQEMQGRFDFAMIHHAFEHVPDPLETLVEFRRLLAPGRTLLVRVPIASSAWEEYGIDWVQLDAPRHFYLHTEKSMEVLAGKTGFKVRYVVFDSTEFQFWGSEQYRKGVALRDPSSHAMDASRSGFTSGQISGFRARAEKWNQERRGDQACFFLQVL